MMIIEQDLLDKVSSEAKVSAKERVCDEQYDRQ